MKVVQGILLSAAYQREIIIKTVCIAATVAICCGDAQTAGRHLLDRPFGKEYDSFHRIREMIDRGGR